MSRRNDVTVMEINELSLFSLNSKIMKNRSFMTSQLILIIMINYFAVGNSFTNLCKLDIVFSFIFIFILEQGVTNGCAFLSIGFCSLNFSSPVYVITNWT